MTEHAMKVPHVHCYDVYPGDVLACVRDQVILSPGDVLEYDGKHYSALPAFNRKNQLVVLRDARGAQIATEVVPEPSRSDLERATRQELPA